MLKIKSYYNNYVKDISIVFLLLLPLTVCNAITFFVGHALNMADLSVAANKFFYLSNLLIGIYPITLCIMTSYYISTKHAMNAMVVVPYSLILFTAVSIPNGLVAANTGLPNNPFIALLSAVISALCCVYFRLYPLDPSHLDFVKRLYKQATHFFGFLLLTLMLEKLTEIVIYLSLGANKFIALNSLTFIGGLAYQFILGLLGAIGINGHNFLFRAKQQLFESTQLNLSAWQAGDASLNILSQGFYDAFLSMGGSGNTISLLLCILLFSKDRRHITLALTAIPLVIFNINELLLFGLPIIFNPILIVPFVFVPLVSFIVVYSAMSLGIVNHVDTIVDWMTPPLLSGYVTTQDSVGGVILQLVVIIIGIMIYRPFYLNYAGRSLQDNSDMLRQSELDSSTISTFMGDVNQMMGSYVSKYEISRRINKMLCGGEFVMYYQPQVNMRNPSQLSFEALVRYKDKTGKLMPPVFIDDFYQLGAIKQLDKMVINLVLQDMKTLPLSHGCKVSVNVSAESIADPAILRFILERMRFYNVDAANLEVEITEEAIITNNEHITKNIDALQALGITVAIDDFGSGYASFPHLLKFNFDKVKLDRSLLINTQNERERNLYLLLANISEVTGCELVAEGIETEQEKQFVEQCGIDICQGYYFSKPMPLVEAQVWANSKVQQQEN